ncbi:MAG: hypothetical protein ABIH37_04620 [archaeon]
MEEYNTCKKRSITPSGKGEWYFMVEDGEKATTILGLAKTLAETDITNVRGRAFFKNKETYQGEPDILIDDEYNETQPLTSIEFSDLLFEYNQEYRILSSVSATQETGLPEFGGGA